MRILLIEDDMKIASFILKGMKEAGFAIDHAEDGEDGFHLAVTEPYDAAIIDLMLPKLDGLTIIEKLRDQKINTPVIILSAKRTLDDRIRGLETGGDDYLTKPFVEFGTIRMDALVLDVCELFEPLAEKKKLRLICNTSDPLKIDGDLKKIQRMVSNLLDNAIKYSPDSGTVTVSLWENGKKQVVLCVRDIGIGISPEDIPFIFDRFYRGDRSRSKPGSGLGLSLVRAIVMLHGGRITVQSEPEKGTAFTVFLEKPADIV